MVSLEDLRRRVAGRIRVGESLAPFTALGIGGPAAFLVEPSTEEAFVAAVGYFRTRDIPCLLIRRGCNLLVAPGGYDGAAISVEGGLAGIAEEDRTACRAGGGTHAAALVEYCITRGLAGAESLAGIDGTVAGVLVRDGAPLEGALRALDVLRDGTVVRLDRTAALRRGDAAGRDVILGAAFRFAQAPKGDLLRARRSHLVAHMRARPLNIPQSAVMFRDPPGGRAAELIASSGVRAPGSGSLAFAPGNPNVIVRTGDAAPADVLETIDAVRRAVRRRHGVTLEPALTPVGFGARVRREVA